MAFDNINNQIGDYKIELIWIDSQSDPAKAAAAYAEAVERKGMEVGMLNWHSSVAISVMDVAAQYKVPHLFAFGAAPIINEKYKSDPEKYKYWCGKGWPVPAKLTLGYTECLQDAIAKGLWKPAKKLVAIYGEDTDWGRSQGEALTQEFKKIGLGSPVSGLFPADPGRFLSPVEQMEKRKRLGHRGNVDLGAGHHRAGETGQRGGAWGRHHRRRPGVGSATGTS